MSRIYEIFGTNAHAMTRAPDGVRRRSVAKSPPGALGGLAQPGGRLPETGATTHAGVLSGAIEYLRDHGFRDISIIEGSWVGGRHRPGLPAAGYEAVGRSTASPSSTSSGTRPAGWTPLPRGPWTSGCRALDADTINLPVLRATARPP